MVVLVAVFLLLPRFTAMQCNHHKLQCVLPAGMHLYCLFKLLFYFPILCFTLRHIPMVLSFVHAALVHACTWVCVCVRAMVFHRLNAKWNISFRLRLIYFNGSSLCVGAIWALPPHTINTEWIFIFLQNFYIQNGKTNKSGAYKNHRILLCKLRTRQFYPWSKAKHQLPRCQTMNIPLPLLLPHSLCLFLCSIAVWMHSCNHKYKLHSVHTKNASNIRFSTSKVYTGLCHLPAITRLFAHSSQPIRCFVSFKMKIFCLTFSAAHTHTHFQLPLIVIKCI